MAIRVKREDAEAALDDESLALDMLEDELDEDDVPAHLIEARMEAFRLQMDEMKSAKQAGSGELKNVGDEKELFKLTTTQPRVICHFMHPDFRRCGIMNEHLRELAKKHFTTLFVYINAEQAPFLNAKFSIKELPSVFAFINGVVKDRLIGFVELGNSDNFATSELEQRLSRSGVITLTDSALSKATERKGRVFGFARGKKEFDEDSDDSDSD
eukprot:m.18786 g.18786  ORF g.18786 m.18786 type:complete len:213 (-) comp5012_c0_seq1:167-805(-)